jgi:hypothetical protein
LGPVQGDDDTDCAGQKKDEPDHKGQPEYNASGKNNFIYRFFLEV